MDDKPILSMLEIKENSIIYQVLMYYKVRSRMHYETILKQHGDKNSSDKNSSVKEYYGVDTVSIKNSVACCSLNLKESHKIKDESLLSFISNIDRSNSFILCSSNEKKKIYFHIWKDIQDSRASMWYPPCYIENTGFVFAVCPISKMKLYTNRQIDLSSCKDFDPTKIKAEMIGISKSDRKCSTCGHIDIARKMKVCTGCKTYNYCNRECQKKHWSEHKKVCATIKKYNISK